MGSSKRIAHIPYSLIFLGLASILPYLYAWFLQDLRKYTIEFLVAFFAAFILYAASTMRVVKMQTPSKRSLMVTIFALALLFNGLLVLTPPTLSDDMYRYVWDGRVQAQGINPYRYSPKSDELQHLRDSHIWPSINRKSAVTVYPPAAEMAFAVLWKIHPDSVNWFQVVMASIGILAGGLLVGVLHSLDRNPARVLIYLWSPLLIFETAHSAHVDALILPLLVGAWWARLREHDGLVGALLGIATSIKLYPALLLPPLWRPHHLQGRWRMPLAFTLSLAICYLPYIILSNSSVIGFLPTYFGERFNISPLVYWLLQNIPHERLVESQHTLTLLTLGLAALSSLVMALRPAKSGESAIRRCLWPMFLLLLLSPNLFSWYMLWMLPLVAITLQPGQIHWRGQTYYFGLRLDPWTSGWLFCGLTALSYTFFIDWKSIPSALQAEFWPLYLLLLASLYVELVRRNIIPHLNPRNINLSSILPWRTEK